jgi:hypothetical protein
MSHRNLHRQVKMQKTRQSSPPGEDANNKARAGFEPAYDGFANRCLSQLGDRAVWRIRYMLNHFWSTASSFGYLLSMLLFTCLMLTAQFVTI